MPATSPPPLFLRLAVVIGLTTLVIGLAGAVVIVFKRPISVAVDAPPGRLPPAVIEGWEESADWSVVARWESEAGPEEVAGTVASEASGWSFPGAPAGVPLTIVVRRRTQEGGWEDQATLRRTRSRPGERLRLE